MIIEIYSKPDCPYCVQAENLCKQNAILIDYKKYMLDEDFTRDDLFEKFPTARTFPQITVDGESIGGFMEFKEIVNSKRS
jgi:glutaredoxin 3